MPTAPETIELRRRIWEKYYHYKKSQARIAADEGITQQAVSKHLRSYDRELDQKFGKLFDPDVYVTRTLERMETRRSWLDREYQRALPGVREIGRADGSIDRIEIKDSPALQGTRRRATIAAHMVDKDIINLLHDVGLIEQQLGRVVISAGDIAKALQEMGDDADVTDGELISEGERRLLPASNT